MLAQNFKLSCESCHESQSYESQWPCMLTHPIYPPVPKSQGEWELLANPEGNMASGEGVFPLEIKKEDVITTSPIEEFIPVSYYDEDYSDEEFVIDVEGQRYFDQPTANEDETPSHTPIVRETRQDNTLPEQVVSDGLETNNMKEWICLLNDVMFVPQDRRESIARDFSELHLMGVYDMISCSLPIIEDMIQDIDITPIEMSRLIEFIEEGRPRNELYYLMNNLHLSHYFDALLLLEDPIIDIMDIREMSVIEMDEVIDSLNMRPREGRRFRRLMCE